jgi:cytochrome c oxidase subunit III
VAEHTTGLAHHFEDMDQQRETATLGMWAFLITEVLFFGGMFTAYIVYRYQYPVAFVEGSHHLDMMMGAINTAVLICSSLTMALAVRAAQVNQRTQIIVFLVLTIVLGAVFLGIKGMEYHHKYVEHLIPGPSFHAASLAGPQVQLFFSLYFAMTGMHAFHMVIGIGLMVWMIARSSLGHFSSDYYAPVEMVGLYWHFVDIVWIFLFPLLYLLGKH